MSYVNSRDDGLPMSEVKQIGLDLLFGLSVRTAFCLSDAVQVLRRPFL